MAAKRALKRHDAWALAVFAASALLVTLSLVTASGATPIEHSAYGSSYHTEWAKLAWVYAGYAMGAPLLVLSYRFRDHAGKFLIAALIPQIWLPFQVLINAVLADQAGPLFVMAFIHPVVAGIIYGLFVWGGWYVAAPPER